MLYVCFVLFFSQSWDNHYGLLDLKQSINQSINQWHVLFMQWLNCEPTRDKVVSVAQVVSVNVRQHMRLRSLKPSELRAQWTERRGSHNTTSVHWVYQRHRSCSGQTVSRRVTKCWQLHSGVSKCEAASIRDSVIQAQWTERRRSDNITISSLGLPMTPLMQWPNCEPTRRKVLAVAQWCQ